MTAEVRNWITVLVASVLGVLVGLVLIIFVKGETPQVIGLSLIISSLSAIGIHYVNNVGPLGGPPKP